MRAFVQNGYGSAAVYEPVQLAIPAPKDKEVLVKVCTTAINDWEWGVLKAPWLVRMLLGPSRPRGKFRTMGCDMAGTVEAVGRKVTRFKPGDAVYCDLSGYRFGGFAEYVCVAEMVLGRKPPSMSFEQAAALPHAAELALQALRAAPKLTAGQQVLVNGAGGGVGTLAVQLLKPLGVETTGVDRAEKLELLRSLGYDHTIEYPRQDFTRLGRQYDFILDARTDKLPWDYLRALAPGGTFATIGGERIFRFMLAKPVAGLSTSKRLKIVGLRPNRNLDQINELFESGKLIPVIDTVFELADIREALERFRRAEHKGKIIIKVA